mgnify:CR=1 FL=1
MPALLAHEGDGTGVLDFETFYTILETIATDETSQVRAALHHRPLSEAEREAASDLITACTMVFQAVAGPTVPEGGSRRRRKSMLPLAIS